MLMMPSDDAKKEMMACARSKMNPDNSGAREEERIAEEVEEVA